MKTFSLLSVLLAASFVACSSGDKTGADTDSSAAAAEAEETAPSTQAVPDSIPMSVTITLPSVTEPAATLHGGTFRSAGKGARCEHIEDGGGDEWAVIFPGSNSDSLGAQAVQLTVGRLTGNSTSYFNVTAVAGFIQGAGGPKMPITHHIATGRAGAQAPGTTMGSGTVTVTREGQRVRFEVDAISGTTKKAFKMTLVCEREGKWV